MDRTRAALLVAAACAVGRGVLALAEPRPIDAHELAARLGDPGCRGPGVGASAPASRIRVATWAGHPVAYDAERDATLLASRYCNHALVPPGLWVEGDHMAGDLRGNVLLRPTAAVLLVEPAPPLERAPPGPPAGIASAVAPAFRVASPWPPFLAHAGLLALGLAALALTPPGPLAPRVASALAPVLAVAAATGLRGGWWVVAALLSFALAPIALATVALAAYHLARRRPPSPLVVALATATVAFLAATWHTAAYFPTGGAGD